VYDCTQPIRPSRHRSRRAATTPTAPPFVPQQPHPLHSSKPAPDLNRPIRPRPPILPSSLTPHQPYPPQSNPRSSPPFPPHPPFRLIHPRNLGLDSSSAPPPLPPAAIAFILSGVVSGMAFLHSTMGIWHGDLKPLNMLLTDKGVVKLCDFGCSRLLQQGNVDLSEVGVKRTSPHPTSPPQASPCG
jgi:hypothetical protein